MKCIPFLRRKTLELKISAFSETPFFCEIENISLRQTKVVSSSVPLLPNSCFLSEFNICNSSLSDSGFSV